MASGIEIGRGMRVGLDLVGVPPRKTGIRRYAGSLTRALALQDARAQYFAFGGNHILDELGEASNITRVECSSAGRSGRRLAEQLSLPGRLKRYNLDLVHSVNNTLPVLSRLPSVVTVHDLTFFRLSAQRFEKQKTAYYRIFVPMSLRHATRIICVSSNTARDLALAYGITKDKTRCVYNGLDSDFGRNSDRVFASPYVLFVGAVEPVKNVLRLIEAYHMFRARRGGDHALVIAGPLDRSYEKARESVTRLGLLDRVVFTGEVSDSEIKSLHKYADAFIFPSLYEGFGLPVLEAMACGTPVVTSNTSSLPEVAGDAALLVDPESVEEIASAMEKILTDPDLRSELSRKGRERAGLFTWERCARETLEVYREVLGGTR